MITLEHGSHTRQISKNARQDVRRHFHQSFLRVVERKILMLMFVEATEIHLAHAFDRGVAEHFCQGTDLQAPITGNAIGTSEH